MIPFSKSLPRTITVACLSLSLGSSLVARDLLIDARGGTPYRTLASAVVDAKAGDTLVIAKGSGPYRETLFIKQSGTTEAPIVVEGNGETVTSFEPLVFQRAGDIFIATLPQPFPVVITHLGVRILQDPVTGTFLGPIKLRDDKRTLELLPGTSTEGWEASKRDVSVRILNVSYQTYRNLVATGATNDGFNLHGKGEGLRFENITGCNNIDEGYSSHEEISAEIVKGEFWANDNGIFNIGKSVVRATGVKIHDNLGWGFGLGGEARGELTDVQIWGNGMAQFVVESKVSGTCDRVLIWAPTWTARPWRSYTESATSKAAPCVFRGVADHLDPAKWQGSPQIATTPIPSPPKAATAANPSLASSGK